MVDLSIVFRKRLPEGIMDGRNPNHQLISGELYPIV